MASLLQLNRALRFQMRMIPDAVFVFFSACVLAVSFTSQLPKDTIYIDGRKNPELIPEYVLWEHGFGGLALINEKNLYVAVESLNLPPKDLALVFQEAGRQKMREEESVGQQRRRRQALTSDKVRPEQLLLEVQKVILDYRWSVLHARDRLLAAMTPEGQTALLTWMEARRANIEAFVPRAEREFFRQPR